MTGVERKVAEAEAQAREPFRQVRHVAATVERESRGEEGYARRDAETEARARADQVVLDGPFHEEGGGEQDGDHADPRGPARTDPLLQVEPRDRGRSRRRRLGVDGGALNGLRGRAPRGRRQGLVSRRREVHGGGNGRGFRRELNAGALLLQRPHAVEQVAHPLLEAGDALRGRRLARKRAAVPQHLERHDQRSHGYREDQKRHSARSLAREIPAGASKSPSRPPIRACSPGVTPPTGPTGLGL